LGGATRTFTVADVTASAADDLLVSAIIGNGAVTKAGAGTMLQSNTNTYAGVTTINAGALVATVAGSLGAAASQLNLAGGTFVVRNNAAVSFATKAGAPIGEFHHFASARGGGAGVTHTFGTLSIGTFTLTTTYDNATVTSGDAAVDFSGLATLTGNATITPIARAPPAPLPRFNAGMTDGGVARTLTINNTSANATEEAVVFQAPANVLEHFANRSYRNPSAAVGFAEHVGHGFRAGAVRKHDRRRGDSRSPQRYPPALSRQQLDSRRQRRTTSKPQYRGRGLTFNTGAVTVNGDRTLNINGNGNLTANTPYTLLAGQAP
jgi:autotransporter-associated beta strand protein